MWARSIAWALVGGYAALSATRIALAVRNWRGAAGHEATEPPEQTPGGSQCYSRFCRAIRRCPACWPKTWPTSRPPGSSGWWTPTTPRACASRPNWPTATRGSRCFIARPARR
ncbi:protein of unknown function [Micropruina glycogenica]|uniref:Uncharacterized protein n=1 Tax=Micropruina glycogenica TaxID=75385 RepID=A0A2N9JHN3_9ACTN|nr:protein of unknown function [Micropruina glycogenica]